MAASRLETLLRAQLDALPSCSYTPVLKEVVELLAVPGTDLRELAASIDRDPELAERVMELMAQQTGRRVQNVLQGIRLIGLTALWTLLAEIAGVREQSGFRVTLDELLQDELLDHSSQVGLCSYLIAVEIGYRQPSEAYAAGLLHDLGLALLKEASCEELCAALAASTPQATTLITAEDAILGGNHAYLGSKLLEHWQAPLGVVAAVAHHHAPHEAQTGQRLARIVHLAEAGISCLQAESDSMPADEAALSSLRMAPDRLLQLARRAIEHHASQKGHARVFQA